MNNLNPGVVFAVAIALKGTDGELTYNKAVEVISKVHPEAGKWLADNPYLWESILEATRDPLLDRIVSETLTVTLKYEALKAMIKAIPAGDKEKAAAAIAMLQSTFALAEIMAAFAGNRRV